MFLEAVVLDHLVYTLGREEEVAGPLSICPSAKGCALMEVDSQILELGLDVEGSPAIVERGGGLGRG